MCIAVPMRVVNIRGKEAVVELEGVKRSISVELIDNVRKGEYVIVHAGFAIQKLNRGDAEKTLKLLSEMIDNRVRHSL